MRDHVERWLAMVAGDSTTVPIAVEGILALLAPLAVEQAPEGETILSRDRWKVRGVEQASESVLRGIEQAARGEGHEIDPTDFPTDESDSPAVGVWKMNPEKLRSPWLFSVEDCEAYREAHEDERGGPELVPDPVEDPNDMDAMKNYWGRKVTANL